MASSKEFLASHLNGRDLIKIILDNEKEMKKKSKRNMRLRDIRSIALKTWLEYKCFEVHVNYD